MPGQLQEKIKMLQENPELVNTMGQNARRQAETVYDKSILCKQFASVVDNIKI